MSLECYLADVLAKPVDPWDAFKEDTRRFKAALALRDKLISKPGIFVSLKSQSMLNDDVLIVTIKTQGSNWLEVGVPDDEYMETEPVHFCAYARTGEDAVKIEKVTSHFQKFARDRSLDVVGLFFMRGHDPKASIRAVVFEEAISWEEFVHDEKDSSATVEKLVELIRQLPKFN